MHRNEHVSSRSDFSIGLDRAAGDARYVRKNALQPAATDYIRLGAAPLAIGAINIDGSSFGGVAINATGSVTAGAASFTTLAASGNVTVGASTFVVTAATGAVSAGVGTFAAATAAVLTARSTNTSAQVIVDTLGAASVSSQVALQNNGVTKWQFGYQIINTTGEFEIYDTAASRVAVKIATGATGLMTLTGSLAITGALSVGTSTPHTSAQAQGDTTAKGWLFPRMTTVQKNAIGTPATGLVVFDTTLAKLCVYTGAAWETITSI